jgi:hypothetical protein
MRAAKPKRCEYRHHEWEHGQRGGEGDEQREPEHGCEKDGGADRNHRFPCLESGWFADTRCECRLFGEHV